jgi:hypothetical protein
MASHQVTADVKAVARGVYQIEWTATVAGSGNEFTGPGLLEKTVQFIGPTTAGTSSMQLEGNNSRTPSDGDWTILTSPTDGQLIHTATTNLMFLVRETPYHVRPNFTVVTSGGPVSVILTAR